MVKAEGIGSDISTENQRPIDYGTRVRGRNSGGMGYRGGNNPRG